jgi:4-methylaminobutanoate oxidase (formaldehyde-forming)
LGWELYIPTEFMQDLYDRIIQAGEALGLVHAGYHALNSLRMEKAYRHWSHDITDEDSPLEAGLDFVVKFDKPGGFIGREALLKLKDKGLSRRLLQFQLRDPAPLIYHNEPVWRDGVLVGHITSGAYGHTLGSAVGLGYVQCEPGADNETVLDGRYEIEVACERVPATASIKPLYDPDNKRIRA